MSQKPIGEIALAGRRVSEAFRKHFVASNGRADEIRKAFDKRLIDIEKRLSRLEDQAAGKSVGM